jgi:hypothetical protein
MGMTTCSGSNGLLVRVKPARRNGNTALATGPNLNTETQTLEHRLKLAVACTILRIDLDDENTRPLQEVHKPIQSGFESLDGMQPPINESNIELTAWEATGCCRRDATKPDPCDVVH